ncbi:MAG: hypothetical protein FGM26_00225 [Beijerinckiaceae bacterium]|nr:hypothetical protein [Beijerinckiaceae bacterium]
MTTRSNDPDLPSATTDEQLPLLVRLELELVRMRRRLIGDEQSDPVWAMVLELCAARLEGRELSVTSLCLASGLPVTTALRRLDELERDGKITRNPDRTDRRRVFVALDAQFHDRILVQLLAMNRLRQDLLPIATNEAL